MANTEKTTLTQLTRLFTSFAFLFALSGCGQKGDLYLPKHSDANLNVIQKDSFRT